MKLWSFEKQKCVATLSDHKQAVWSVKYHHGGDWLASCSLDHSVRCVAVAMWPLGTGTEAACGCEVLCVVPSGYPFLLALHLAAWLFGML